MSATAQHLTQLEGTGLIRLAAMQPEVEYLFRHALVQEAAYTAILKIDRKRLHQRVGEAIETAYPDRLDELAPMLARHFDEAGDEVKALHYFTRAADGAAAIYANVEADMHYARAIALAGARGDRISAEELIHLYTSRGRVLELNARYDEALANYAAMMATAQRRGDKAMELSAVMAQTTIHAAPTARYDPERGAALSERARALAQELGDGAAEAKVLWNLMLINRFIGNWRASVQYGEQALALARRLNLREQLAFIINDIVYVYPAMGSPEQARALIQEVLGLWRELGNQPMLADALSGNSGLATIWGEYDSALALAAEARRISESIGNLWGQSYSRFYVGMVHFERGDYAEAIGTMLDCIRLGEQAGFVVPQVDTRCYLALVYGELGAIEPGLELARLAFAAAQKVIPLFQAYPIVLEAWLHARTGHRDEAQRALRKGLALLDLNDPGMYEGNSLRQLVEAEVLLGLKDYARLVEHTTGALEFLGRLSARSYRSQILWYRGLGCLRTGDLPGAESALTEGRALAESLNARTPLWRLLAAQAELAEQRGRKNAAADLLRQARETLHYLVDHSPADLRASFLAQPDVRAVLNSAV